MLVTASLYPQGVRVDMPGSQQECTIIETPNAAEIEHLHGTLAIEAREQMLSLGLAPSGVSVPNMCFTVTYYRRSGDCLYYPELLIPVAGFARLSRRP